MKSSKINYILVGGFILSVAAAFIVSLALLSGRTGNVDTFYTVYGNVTGIKYGTQVLYEGYPVGQVEGIAPFESKGQMLFKVEMSVIEGWKIPKDSVARAAASGLLSAIAINISAGDSTENLTPGDAVRGEEQASLFGAISTVASEISELSDSIKPVLLTVDQTVRTVGDMLTQDGAPLLRDLRRITDPLGVDVPVIVSNVKETTEALRRIVSDENSEKISAIIANLQSATSNLAALSIDLKTTAKQLDTVIANAEGAVKGVDGLLRNADGLLKNADGLVTNADGMITDNRESVAKAVEDLRHTAQSVSRRIDAINENLEGASRNMYEFSRNIRQNPGLLLGAKPPSDDVR